MADEKDKKQGNDKPERLEERKIPDLNERKSNDWFNKSEESNRSDKSDNEDGYISKPRISSELPPDDAE